MINGRFNYVFIFHVNKIKPRKLYLETLFFYLKHFIRCICSNKYKSKKTHGKINSFAYDAVYIYITDSKITK